MTRTRRATLRSGTLLFAALALAWGHDAAHARSAVDTTAAVLPDSVAASLPEVVVSTSRAGDRMPIAHTTLSRAKLQQLDWGQDTPMALTMVPGVYAYSDAGNGVGYSYLSIRGFPQRRISVLINGVPLNDPESQEVWWIDHPDLLASGSELQVQRGVGAALHGAASLGGSVNIETAPFTDTPGASVVAGYGSFETKRLMLEMNSGRIGGWNFYGRYSRIESFGYRDQSDSRLWSYSLSARRTFERQSWRVNLYGGPEETHLAYLGVPADYLDGRVTGDANHDRRFNPITYPDERDHFFEPHYELMHNWAPRAGLTVTQTLFYYDGDGYYDEQRFGRALTDYRLTPWYTSDSTLAPRDYYAQNPDGSLTQTGSGQFQVVSTDLVRRRTVVNRHYGWIPRVRIEHRNGALTVGGELRGHDGRHYGQVVSGGTLPPGTPPDAAYYDYHPRTLSGGLFAREEWQAAPDLRVTADLAWRHQGYDMRDDAFDGINFRQPYNFALPRLGVTFTPKSAWSGFASVAWASREPSFRDLYDAESSGSVPLFEHVDPVTNTWTDPLIHPEHVMDLEVGGAWHTGHGRVAVNVFRMDFRDELVYAGQFDTDLGYPILGNAARSRHQGVEFDAHHVLDLPRAARVTLEANATLSDNHFIDYAEQWGPLPGDVVRYDGNALGLFPAQLANVTARLDAGRATLGAEYQYAGRIYVDNTESLASSIGPRRVLNLNAAWRVPFSGASRTELSLRALNVLDERYATSGYPDYDASGALVPHFIPAATRNFIAQVRVDF